MPVQLGNDSTGCYARWGQEGKKYYYKCGNEIQRDNAKHKALMQGIAIGEYAVAKNYNIGSSGDYPNTEHSQK